MADDTVEPISFDDKPNSLEFARRVICEEAEALRAFAETMSDAICRASQLIADCRGNVVVTGMGKAGLIGQKISATLSSTGTPSHFLHPAEAVHGDLGKLQHDDVVLALSKSGETDELTRLIPFLLDMPVPIVAITGSSTSTLGRLATATIELGAVEEVCPLRLAPTTSTTLMLAIGDALSLLISRAKNFGSDDFGRRHPAGMLGWQLSSVDHHMRPLSTCRVAQDDKTVRRVFTELSRPGRRSGAIILVDRHGKLSGLFTDSDLARLFEHDADHQLDWPIQRVMTQRPLKVSAGTKMSQAIELISSRRISELPVVDDGGRPIGLLDITDLIRFTAEAVPELDSAATERRAA